MSAAAKKAPAGKAKGTKPAAPVVQARATPQASAAGVSTYRVLARIWHDGQLLRPANADKDREADTVELTERQAYGLRGFVQPLPAEATTEATTTDNTSTESDPAP